MHHYATTVLPSLPVYVLQFGLGRSREDLLTWKGWSKTHLTHKALTAVGLALRIWGNAWPQLRATVGAPPIVQLTKPASWPLLWQHSKLGQLAASLSSSDNFAADVSDSKLQQQQQQQQQQALQSCEPLLELHFNSLQVEPPRPMPPNRVRGAVSKLASAQFHSIIRDMACHILKFRAESDPSTIQRSL
jgi:hypothetical protein